jgi:hypothetical protein
MASTHGCRGKAEAREPLSLSQAQALARPTINEAEDAVHGMKTTSLLLDVARRLEKFDNLVKAIVEV